MEMMKKLTITQRELVRNWVRLKMKLKDGQADQLVIPENGHAFILTYRLAAKRPGNISGLLAKLKKQGLRKRTKLPPRIPWTLKSFKLLKKLRKK